MLRIDNVLRTNFDAIPVDSFWNTGAEKESRMHRIHSYPAKFPAFITTKALTYAQKQSLKVETIADIFCGCGTTAYEAKRNDIEFWGCDLNPVATLIAKTKSRKYQDWRVKKYFQAIMQHFDIQPVQDCYSSADDRLKYWFKKTEYNELTHLKQTIEKILPTDSDYHRFFICAFSNILKSTSVWLTKSIKPQVDPEKIPANVRAAFVDQCKLMIYANLESDLVNKSKTNIVTGNFLNEDVKKPKVDLIVTSPPYVTSYEYADLHQLSSLWLEYASDYRDLREGSIGSLHHDYNFNKEIKRLNITGGKIVSRLINNKNKSKARSVAKYFLDMQSVARESFNMLNENSMALFVIGNTEYKGVQIDNAKHLCESLIQEGFSEVSVTKRKISKKILTPYRDKKGRFTTDSKGRKVYNEEFIVVGRK